MSFVAAVRAILLALTCYTVLVYFVLFHIAHAYVPRGCATLATTLCSVLKTCDAQYQIQKIEELCGLGQKLEL